MKKTIDVVKYLVNEIENEIILKEKYDIAKTDAENKAREYNKNKKPEEREILLELS